MDKNNNVLFRYREDYDPENRIVKQEYGTYKGKEYFVSTVDLGMDHQYGEGEPLYYETMIFLKDSWIDLYCDRYTTREEALAGHNHVIECFKRDLMILVDGYFEIESKGE